MVACDNSSQEADEEQHRPAALSFVVSFPRVVIKSGEIDFASCRWLTWTMELHF